MTAFERWRGEARRHLVREALPDEVDWCAIMRGATAIGAGMAAPSNPAPANSAPGDGAAESRLRISAPMLRLLQAIALHRTDGRWDLMYRLVWRSRNENPRLLDDFADRDVHAAIAMEKTVRREIHKMHAFVRFREVTAEPQAQPTYFAWFEPAHDILAVGAKFFMRRFPNMHWIVATPEGAAVWDLQQLRFIDGPAQDRAGVDRFDQLWRVYYRSICNGARINPAAMRREMPVRYWKHLPEAGEIYSLLHARDRRLAESEVQAPNGGIAVGKALKAVLTAPMSPADDVNACQLCPLWRQATQAVLGEGGANARIMLVGEQPGDEEDLRGRPFVGPAGQVLDQALALAGLERADLFITNAVKHFKWEPRGRRRLHKKPSTGEVDACGVWLEREIAAVRPDVIVALGATALRALTGSTLAVSAARLHVLSHPTGAVIMATFHPAAILRADAERADDLRQALIADLKRAAQTLGRMP